MQHRQTIETGRRGRDGFTLLEVLMSIALISILAGLSLPFVPRWQQLNDIDIATVSIGQSLRRAQVLSQAISQDSLWGVGVDQGNNDQIVVFKGTSYASRDAAYDEVFDLPSTISVAGLNEVVFAKMTGLPSNIGTFALTTNTNQTSQVTVNSQGTVGY